MKTANSLPDGLANSADGAAKTLGLSRRGLIPSQRAIIEKLNKVYAAADSSVPSEIRAYQNSQLKGESC